MYGRPCTVDNMEFPMYMPWSSKNGQFDLNTVTYTSPTVPGRHLAGVYSAEVWNGKGDSLRCQRWHSARAADVLYGRGLPSNTRGNTDHI
jgi:hypothetical protein